VGRETVRLVITTVEDGEQASSLAGRLVEERLAACVSVLPPMVSTYRWRGRIETAEERLLLIKTAWSGEEERKSFFERLAAMHPYEEPEILSFDADHAAEGYLDWLLRGLEGGGA